MRPLRAAALTLVLAAQPLPAQQGGANPVRTERAPLAMLNWMSGCWRATTARGIVIEETYTTPTQNLMQGMTRYLRDDRVADFKFTTIVADSAGLTLRPQPRGGTAVSFPLKGTGRREATWENLQHDFPQRIRYARPHDDTLVARIEGPGPTGSTRSSEWRMAKVVCP